MYDARYIDIQNHLKIPERLESFKLANGLEFTAKSPRALPKRVAYLGRISCSVFLLHFPLCLLVNAAIHRVAPDDPAAAAAGMLLAWAASSGAGALFYHYVENPIAYGRDSLATRSR